MKVLHLSTDIDSGSGRGAFDLHRQLLALGVESNFLAVMYPVPGKTIPLSIKHVLSAKALPRIERTLLSMSGAQRSKVPFSISPSWLHSDLFPFIEEFTPDVVHLHWVWRGFVSPSYARKISQRVPVVWTLRDTAVITGGCHIMGSCDKWRTSCGGCPVLGSGNANDLAHRQHEQKVAALGDANVTLVATSQRMHRIASASRLSNLLHPKVIPISINTDIFVLRDRASCQAALGLNPDRLYVLFSGLDCTRQAHKGWGVLLEIMSILGDRRTWDLIVVGDDAPSLAQIPGVIPVGKLSDNLSLSILYAAANVTIMPSSEESFGKVAAESLSVGTPVVLSSETGAVDIVEDRVTGWIIDPTDPVAAIAAIDHFLSMDLETAKQTSLRCAATSVEFGKSAAEAHVSLYADLVSKFKR